MHDKDLNLLNIQPTTESPLVQMEEALPQPSPEEMLLLLTSSEPSQRMMAARAFCELQDERAIALLINC